MPGVGSQSRRGVAGEGVRAGHFPSRQGVRRIASQTFDMRIGGDLEVRESWDKRTHNDMACDECTSTVLLPPLK